MTVRDEGQAELVEVSAVLRTTGRTAADVTRSLAAIAKRVDEVLPDLGYDSVRTDLVVALTSLPDVQGDGPGWSLRHDSALEQQARVAAVRSAVTRALPRPTLCLPRAGADV